MSMDYSIADPLSNRLTFASTTKDQSRHALLYYHKGGMSSLTWCLKPAFATHGTETRDLWAKEPKHRGKLIRKLVAAARNSIASHPLTHLVHPCSSPRVVGQAKRQTVLRSAPLNRRATER